MNFDGYQIFVLYTQTVEICQMPGYKTLKTIKWKCFRKTYLLHRKKKCTFTKFKHKYDLSK